MFDGRSRLFVATKRLEGLFRKREKYTWAPSRLSELGDLLKFVTGDLYAMSLSASGEVVPNRILAVDRTDHGPKNPRPGKQVWATEPDGEVVHELFADECSLSVSMGGWKSVGELGQQNWRLVHVPDVDPVRQQVPRTGTARVYRVEDYPMEESYRVTLADAKNVVVGGLVVRLG